METCIPRLIEALASAATFEDAAEALLDCAFGLADTVPAGPAQRLRGMVHLRSETGEYSGLVVRAAPGAGPDGPERVVPSATAWAQVVAHRGPVAMNVATGQMDRLTRQGTPAAPETAPSRGAHRNANATLERLRARGTSHLLALPIIGADRRIHGLVSIEVDAPTDENAAAFWAGAAAPFGLAIDVAAGALLARPLRPALVLADDPLLPVIGESMRPLVKLLEVFARQPETLLLSGPTGSGKSRLAAWCHARSISAKGPFETVQLLTVPEGMQMASLFGWRRGAFTGAVKDHAGHVTRAEGGTLFIDEVDKLSLAAQAGLLQLLETRTYTVQGELRPRTAEVRFIVGTNVELGLAVREGRFLEDLYYRIHVLPVAVPSLDARRDEVAGWAQYMLDRRHREAGGQGRAKLSGDAARALTARTWPGNLRQLDNVMRRGYAVALAEGGLVGADLEVSRAHVERALGFEQSSPVAEAVQGGPSGPADPASRPTAQAPVGGEAGRLALDRLLRAAEAFVTEVAAARQGGQPLDLDHADAFRACVLHAARLRTGDVRAVFELFGKDQVVAGRNHLREFRREMARLRALCDALGIEPDPDVRASLQI